VSYLTSAPLFKQLLTQAQLLSYSWFGTVFHWRVRDGVPSHFVAHPDSFDDLLNGHGGGFPGGSIATSGARIIRGDVEDGLDAEAIKDWQGIGKSRLLDIIKGNRRRRSRKPACPKLSQTLGE
jgi:hypothetical protein